MITVEEVIATLRELRDMHARSQDFTSEHVMSNALWHIELLIDKRKKEQLNGLSEWQGAE